MKLFYKPEELNSRLNAFVLKHYATIMMCLLFLSNIMTFVAPFTIRLIYFYPATEQYRRCECNMNYENRIKNLPNPNETCLHVPMDVDCFRYLDRAPLVCVDMSMWLNVWRFVLNTEAMLNIVIAITVCRSLYLPKYLSFFCCFSTILSLNVNQKWFALIGGLMSFIGKYVVLFYGFYFAMKTS